MATARARLAVRGRPTGELRHAEGASRVQELQQYAVELGRPVAHGVVSGVPQHHQPRAGDPRCIRRPSATGTSGSSSPQTSSVGDIRPGSSGSTSSVSRCRVASSSARGPARSASAAMVGTNVGAPQCRGGSARHEPRRLPQAQRPRQPRGIHQHEPPGHSRWPAAMCSAVCPPIEWPTSANVPDRPASTHSAITSAISGMSAAARPPAAAEPDQLRNVDAEPRASAGVVKRHHRCDPDRPCSSTTAGPDPDAPTGSGTPNRVCRMRVLLTPPPSTFPPVSIPARPAVVPPSAPYPPSPPLPARSAPRSPHPPSSFKLQSLGRIRYVGYIHLLYRIREPAVVCR
jgi:hypothetical protein